MDILDEKIQQMRQMAEMLIPYSEPIGTMQDEHDVLCLKQREITVDGYDMNVCLSASDWQEYVLWSLQMQSVYFPFLPFNVVCKVGRRFLGDKNLGFLEFAKNGKKVYCWTLRDRFGKRLKPGKLSTPTSYEGFRYSLLNPASVDLH